MMRRENAEVFAAQVLAWLAEDHARLAAFLGWSGESPASLGGRIRDPGLLLAVIEFLLTDEALLIEACDALDVPPQSPGLARAALPGGADYHWT